MEVLATVSAILANPVVQTVLLAVLGLAIQRFVHYKKLVKEVFDVVKKYDEIIDRKSPGGKSITTHEWAALGKEVADVVHAGGTLIKGRKSAGSL